MTALYLHEKISELFGEGRQRERFAVPEGHRQTYPGAGRRRTNHGCLVKSKVTGHAKECG